MNDAQQSRNALPQGYRLQEYELVRVLGFGRFGMTYLGFDDNLDKAVAIKEYFPSDIATRMSDNSVALQVSDFQGDFEYGLARFLDKARTLVRFDHRHIIKVYRFFEAHGTAYIVMEYAEGDTLSAFLERKGVLKEAELKVILYPILDGLEVVHRADFLHCDIKPGNIIIRDEDDSPVLLDFGAVRQAIGARNRFVTSIITPGYTPIEQYSSLGDQGPWTDIYALGAVCYQALTGRIPNDATDRVLNDLLIPVSDYCVGQASAGFLSAIDWALRVNEKDRPQSVAAWRVALEEETASSVNIPPIESVSTPQSESQEQKQVVPPPVKQRDDQSYPPKKTKKKLLTAVICMVALVIGGMSYYEYVYLPGKQREKQATEEARLEAEEGRQRAERVSVLLSGAAEDMASDRLIRPAGNNAWEKFQSVLKLEPGHGIATAGIDSIIARYVAKFESALGSGGLDMAGEYVARIREVYADASVLSELDSRLSAARQVKQRQEVERARRIAVEAEKRRKEQEAERARRAVVEAEKRRKEQIVGRIFRDCGECPQMVVVTSGSFTMGSPDREYGRDDNEGGQHVVRIDYRFAVGVYEVSFAEWDACVADGGCMRYRPDDEGWGRGNRPVINVSWDDAQSYVWWLSSKTGNRYGLLSESEWEYAARAGSVTAYSWGNNIGHNRANCDGCGSQWDAKKTAPVGSFGANGWGLHDMHGNVYEWVQDCWNDNYEGAPADGSARKSGDCDRRVLRSGSWNYSPKILRSASRAGFKSDYGSLSRGFRVIRRF